MRYKKFVMVLLIVAIVLEMMFPCCISIAAATDVLITVGTGSYKITVTKSTSLDEIKVKLGEPKIETPSPFGGVRATFYVDSNYNGYLYVETTDKGEIVCCSSVDPSFVTPENSYGGEINKSDNYYRNLYIENDNSKIIGGTYYNSTVFYRDRDSAKEECLQNPNRYRMGLAKHSFEMAKAMFKFENMESNLIFDEDFINSFSQYGTASEFSDKVTALTSSDYRKVRCETWENSQMACSPTIYVKYARNIIRYPNLFANGCTYIYFSCGKGQESVIAVFKEKVVDIVKNAKLADVNYPSDDEIRMQKHITYATELTNSKMDDLTKLVALSKYTTTATEYGYGPDGKLGGNDQVIEGVFIDREAVCAGFNATLVELLQMCGVPSIVVRNGSTKHDWSTARIDGEWTYMDNTRGASAFPNRGGTFFSYSKSDVLKYLGSYLHRFSQNVTFYGANPYGDTWVEGVSRNSERNYESNIYSDNDYIYYQKKDSSSSEKGAIYRENLTTKKAEKLADSFAKGIGSEKTNIVKDGNKIYYVNANKRSIDSIDLTGKNHKIEYTLSDTTSYIGGIYQDEGKIKYYTYKNDNKDFTKFTAYTLKDFTEWNNITVGEYKVQDAENGYRLIYIKGNKSVAIIKCIGIGNNLPFAKNIKIPTEIEGLPVTRVHDEAFYNCKLITGTFEYPEGMEVIRGYGRNTGIDCAILPSSTKFVNESDISLAEAAVNGKLIVKSSDIDFFYLNVGGIYGDKTIYLPANTKTSEAADLYKIKYKDLDDIIEPKPTVPEEITIEDENLKLKIGQEKQIELNTTLKDFTWTSSNTSVADVDENGKVSGVGNGTAVITVKGYGKEVTCNVEVREAYFVNKIMKIDKVGWVSVPSEPMMAVLDDGREVSVKYTSNNEDVVKAYDNGSIEGWNGGFATLSAYDERYGNLSYIVLVDAGVKIDEYDPYYNQVSRYPGDLNGNYKYDDNDYVKLEEIIKNSNFTSDNMKLGDINGDKVVNSEDLSVLREIIDTNALELTMKPITSVELSSIAWVEKIGDDVTINLRPTFYPEDNAEDKMLIWKSSDESIATVDAKGDIKPVSVGKVQITATTLSGKSGSTTVDILPEYLPAKEIGDTNGDGRITLFDAFEVLKLAIGNEEVTSAELAIMDMNGDGRITLYDAFEILKMAIAG